jgi:uncharacterized membrane protein
MINEQADLVPDQIRANASPLPDQLWAGLRQLAPAAMAFALGRGWLESDVAVLLGVAGGMVWPIVAGQLKTRRRAVQLATVAASPEVPDHVAVLK